jgi:hypothetical protein
VEVVRYDEAGLEESRSTTPLRTTFVVNQATGDRWLIVDEVDP